MMATMDMSTLMELYMLAYMGWGTDTSRHKG